MPVLKVMTFNIHHGKGTDKKVDLERIAEVIKKSGADIIALNEVDKQFGKRSNDEDQVARMAERLTFEHSFSPAITLKSNKYPGGRQYGNALLSRHPIEKKQNHLFQLTGHHTEDRSLLEATILFFGKQQLNIYLTHLSLNPLLHKKQADFIVNKAKEDACPVIILGDFNMKPGTRRWTRFTRSFADVWEKAGHGNGYTYPSFRPRSRLDYIFINSYIDIIDIKVATAFPESSDHLPLLATLSLKHK